MSAPTEMHGIDVEMLVDLAGLSEYWKSAVDFVEQNQNVKYENLSKPQQVWLDKIKDDYEETHLKNFL